jgi:FtsP/CotA-like multicopper oxidase with cupredoxin domain
MKLRGDGLRAMPDARILAALSSQRVDVNVLPRCLSLILSCAAIACASGPPEVVANDNRVAAGALNGDTLTVRLVVQRARWHPEAPDGPFVDVEALGEDGKPPSIPAPLLRVRAGTIIVATVRNALPDSTLWLRGLGTRPLPKQDSVAVPPGESRTITFAAGAPGTYVYGATVGKVDWDNIERETTAGAFVVDSVNGDTNDRVFVMNIWGDKGDSLYRNAVAINGKSFPHTETIEATTGDTVHWRWVNATIRPHPMHLHGFYFNVLSRGRLRDDTVYTAQQQRTAVTEFMDPFTTMSLSFVPDRDGRWLFHCHIAFHAIHETARLDPQHVEHGMMSADPGEHMAGLVLGINVKPATGWTPERRESPRTLRLFVRETAKLGRAPRSLGYALEHGTETPTEPLTRVGGPPIVLTRGQPTDITVINQLKEPTAVHWHGLELESYSDGVVGWSGTVGRTAPVIAPSDSFVARLTMPRAGTFIYHTHLNDIAQLTGGLYGAIIVTEPRDAFDSAFDHVYVVGWDGNANPRALVNGDSALPPMTWRAGSRHRIRLVNIGAAEELTAVIKLDSTTVTWIPVAKDGADLPAHQRVARPAELSMDVGQTADFEFSPASRGEYVLSIRVGPPKDAIRQRIIVR